VSRGDSDDLNRQVGRLLLEESQLLCALARTLAKVDARSAADLASAAHRLATAARGLLEVEHGQGSAIHPNPKLTSPKRALHAVESARVNTSEEENAG
jgi:hypothetical protein